MQSKLKKFQERYMTAMDFWFSLCMMFVALAMFEYAILLTIKYGKQNKKFVDNRQVSDEWAVIKCHKIDFYALRIFTVVYALAGGTYFLIFLTKY